jgi:hypothetical protein
MRRSARLVISILCVLVTTQVNAQTCADLAGASVYSDEASPVYLGFLGSAYASESINNLYGTYGSEYSSMSVRNPYGTYGSNYGSYSANNTYASNPPNIWKHGVIIARLTTNSTIYGGVSLAAIDAYCTFYNSSPTTFNPETPYPLLASDGYVGGVNLSWPPSLGASDYEVYRNTSDSFATSLYLGWVSSAGAVDTSAIPNVTYYYWVAACNSFGCSISLPDTGFAAAEVANVAPVAAAGPDQSVTDTDDSGSEIVTLNGTGSADSDGTIQSYQWFEGGSQIATGVSPEVDLSVGVHVIVLRVTDNDGATDEDSVQVEVVAAPPPATPQSRKSILSVGDVDGNGYPDMAALLSGNNQVHIRDAQTDELTTSHEFGSDPVLDLVVLPDIDNSGRAEIAVLQQQSSGQVRVQIRDSLSGNVVRNLFYGANYTATSMQVVGDYNGNGFPEIAVMGSDANDAIRVQVQDAATGTILDNVFLGNQGFGKDFVAVSDTSGNSVPELGILSVLKGNDQVRMQLWDAMDASFQTNVWFGSVYQPQSMITMPDINANGSDEIVAVGVDPATQNVRVQVRDSASTATHYNIWLGNTNQAVDVALVNDINGNGYPDLAVLLKTPAGTGRVRVQDGLNGAFIRNLFFSAVTNPTGLTVMPDYSGNGFEELAALGENAGVQHVQVLDTSSGAQVNRIDFP